jgi:hypothetical protein
MSLMLCVDNDLRFNKTREHFPSLKDYNDYLEEVEDMTFNLIEGIDVEVIEAKIARYQQENAEQIYLSRAKRVCCSSLRALVLYLNFMIDNHLISTSFCL